MLSATPSTSPRWAHGAPAPTSSIHPRWPPYYVWNEPVFAPCTGQVLLARDGHRDQPPLRSDREHAAGNFVALHCRGHTLMLAHLRQGSVLVEPGAVVERGRLLGHVGNSGNSSEPHLHLHAVVGRVADIERLAWSGPGAPVVFAPGRRYLARGAVVEPR